MHPSICRPLMRALLCLPLLCSVVGVVGAAVVTLTAAPAHAMGTYWTTPNLLKSFFSTSKKVTYVEVTRAELQAKLGSLTKTVAVSKDKYHVFIAKTDEQIDGYAVIDDEKGQHQPISFGIKFSADGKVMQSEIMAYREEYGEEIREGRFQRQFTGKQHGDSVRLGSDIVAISGATISSRSMTLAMQRAMALVAIAREKQ